MKKVISILTVVILILMIIGGCASSYDKAADDGYNMSTAQSTRGVEPAEGRYDDAMDMAEAEEAGFAAGSPQTEGAAIDPSQAGSKIIKTGYLTVETLEFDDANSAIVSKVNALGGFVASSNVEGQSRRSGQNRRMRYAYYEVRVPSKHFDQFLTDMGDLGDVIRNEKRGEDITGQYYDTESRLNSLKVQEERLISILAEAEKLQDILELERELSRVRYEIESHTGTLKKWDNLVDYSTINIELIEVEELKPDEHKPDSYWERISRGFDRSILNVLNFLKDFVVFIVAAIPYIILLAVPTVPTLLILRKIRNKGKNKPE